MHNAVVETLCAAFILATLDSVFRCTMPLVELKFMHCLPMFYVIFHKLLPFCVCSFNSEVYKFPGKLIWTRLLKFTKIIWASKI